MLTMESSQSQSRQSMATTWDIRKEAIKFELNFRELIQQEQELYDLTVDDGMSDSAMDAIDSVGSEVLHDGNGRNHSRDIIEPQNTLEGCRLSAENDVMQDSTTNSYSSNCSLKSISKRDLITVDENITYYLSDFQGNIEMDATRTDTSYQEPFLPKSIKTTSFSSNQKPEVGYIELLFAYKSKSMELYAKQITLLKETLANLEKSSTLNTSIPEPASELEELNKEIDFLSTKLMETQKNKNMATQMMDRDTFNLTAMDQDILHLTKTLFQKLLKFRSISRSSRLAAISALQAQITACTRKSIPLVSIDEISPKNTDDKRDDRRDTKKGGTIQKIITKMASTLSLSRPKIKSPADSTHEPDDSSIPSSSSKSKRSSFLSPANTITSYTFSRRKGSFPSLVHKSREELAATIELTELEQAQAKLSNLEAENELLKAQLSMMRDEKDQTSSTLHSLSDLRSPSYRTDDLDWDESKSAWQQDSWRSEHLTKFKRDLAFIESITNPSIHHTRYRDRLVSRIAALELDDPLSVSRPSLLISPRPRLSINASVLPYGKDEENYEGEDKVVNDKLYRVNRDFDPVEDDEIKLSIGDQVTINMTFINGVAHGMNLTTSESGIFPLSSIELSIVTPQTQELSLSFPHQIDHFNEEGTESTFVNNTQSFSSSCFTNGKDQRPPLTPSCHGNFMSSMTSPQKALSIIANLPAGQRVQYLEKLGAFTPASIQDQPVSPTQSKKNWQNMRNSWQIALRSEIDQFGALPVIEQDYEGSDWDDGQKWNERMRRESFWKLIAEKYKISENGPSDESQKGKPLDS